MKDKSKPLLIIVIALLVGAMVMLWMQFKKLQKPKLKGSVPDQDFYGNIQKLDVFGNVVNSDFSNPNGFDYTAD